ncbi:hypothetical protein Tco_0955885 [Tanacetum coccineum]|uniref:Uncharacterized protein n=1 Tax=Tanacetum coccineum TaxID=301880 RepID=A0ABQ5E8G6_9ASTR
MTFWINSMTLSLDEDSKDHFSDVSSSVECTTLVAERLDPAKLNKLHSMSTSAPSPFLFLDAVPNSSSYPALCLEGFLSEQNCLDGLTGVDVVACYGKSTLCCKVSSRCTFLWGFLCIP